MNDSRVLPYPMTPAQEEAVVISPRERLARMLNERSRTQFHPKEYQMRNVVTYGFYDFVTDDRLPRGEVLASTKPEHEDQILMCHPDDLGSIQSRLATEQAKRHRRGSHS